MTFDPSALSQSWIAVLINFNVRGLEEGGVEPELQFRFVHEFLRFLGRNEGIITIKRCPVVRLHVFDKGLQTLGLCWLLSVDGLSAEKDSE